MKIRLPKSRRDNEYADTLTNEFNYKKIMSWKTITDFLNDFYQRKLKNGLEVKVRFDKYFTKRYYWLNLHSVFYRDTIELRLHSGTISKEKIINWYNLQKIFLKWGCLS